MSLNNQKFEFGDFLLDAKEKTLLRQGKPLAITPKAFQLLLVLVENHGHLIEKDELMKAVWRDSFVEEGNLSFTVTLLRKALDDDAQKPRFIETVPRRGYRFIAAATRVGGDQEKERGFDLIDNRPASSNGDLFSSAASAIRNDEAAHPAAAASARPGRHDEAEAREAPQTAALLKFPAAADIEAGAAGKELAPAAGRRKLAALAAVLSVVAALALGYYFFPGRNSSGGAPKSLAVLPLKPINTAGRDEIYEIGIADSLIHRFSSMRGFVVRPLSAVRKYADIEQDPIAAGREQQVDYVFASNYQLAGGRIRITAQLFNVADGRIEETYKTEKEAGDVFAMQDAVASELGAILLSRFSTTAAASAAKRGTASEEAYRFFLQGIYLYERRSFDDARKGVEILEQALRLDPNYARAWARKAHLHRTIANSRRSTDIQAEYRKSIEAINRALALDPHLADAYSALCDNKMYTEYDFAGAESACRRAIELDPNSALSHQIYARFLNSRGRSDEAIAESKTAIDLDPTSLFNQRVYGTCLFFARRYDEAAAQFRRLAMTDENFINTYFFYILTLEMQGNHPEAFEALAKWLVLQKTDEETLRAFREAYQTSGWPGVTRERIKRFEKSDEVYFSGAMYYAQLGEKEKAFELLEKSYQRRELWLANLKVDPRVDPLRGDARYDRLLGLVEAK